MGLLPASSVFTTSSASRVQVWVISFRYLALGSPSFFCSAMATGMLPASSTTWPMASRRASRPATRTADGPMSTPRRFWPRSRGTPMTRIFFGTMPEGVTTAACVEVSGIVQFVGRSVGPAVGRSFPSIGIQQPADRPIDRLTVRPKLRIQPVQHAREGNGFAHVFQAANPGDHALDAHAESGVGHAAVLAQVEIPLEG